MHATFSVTLRGSRCARAWPHRATEAATVLLPEYSGTLWDKSQLSPHAKLGDSPVGVDMIHVLAESLVG